jgi:hypothetical protein
VTPGNVEFVQVLVSMTVETGGVAAFLYADRRLRPTRRRPGRWLPSTREAAVLGAFLFGALYGGPALIIHFAKSRGALGLVLGLLCAVTVISVDVVAELGAAAAIDWLGL